MLYECAQVCMSICIMLYIDSCIYNSVLYLYGHMCCCECINMWYIYVCTCVDTCKSLFPICIHISGVCSWFNIMHSSYLKGTQYSLCRAKYEWTSPRDTNSGCPIGIF